MAGVGAMSAFTGDPQPVEVFHRGVWYRGELLGWRHDADGRCAARVRAVLDGLRRSAWVDLDLLRLPGAPSPAPRPAAAPGRRCSGEHSFAQEQGTAELEETRPHVLLPRGRSTGRPLPPTRHLLPPPAAAPGLSASEAAWPGLRQTPAPWAQRRVPGRTTAGTTTAGTTTATQTTTPGPGDRGSIDLR